MAYFYDYLLFAAKFLTAVSLLSLPLILLLALRQLRRSGDESALEITNLNDRARDHGLALEAALLGEKNLKQRLKEEEQSRKKRAKDGVPGARSFVCRFSGDLHASAVEQLREEITAVLAVAAAEDEIILVLESGGGTVHDYGFAASQLRRVRDRGIHLKVVVDRIAASGGYMMACIADELIAAPFAIIGSIGVVAQLPNFHRLLRRHDIDFEQVTAGKHKRTLTLFGENTDEGRAKFQEELNDAHALFKEFVAMHRPQVDLQLVATGQWWFASRALSLGLLDRLATSDEVVQEAMKERPVYEIRLQQKASMLTRWKNALGGLIRLLR
ncbi:MAG: protease SohB [Gammaproteobacteria bacterium]